MPMPRSFRKGWSAAESHLCATSPVMRGIIKKVGPCTLAPRRDYFVVLCKAIFSQQISTAVAAVLFGRFRNCFPGRRPTPRLVLEAMDRDPEAFRKCGLSRQKQAYVRNLAEHFATNKIPTRRLATMPDEAVIDALVDVKGIGRWTAEMFLIFTLNRPDVLPVDDLGLRQGAQKVFGLRQPPTAKKLKKLAEPWGPYRSVATWYVWRGSALLAAAARAGGLKSGGKKASGQKSTAAGAAKRPRPARSAKGPSVRARP